jgi:hypothetical protein
MLDLIAFSVLFPKEGDLGSFYLSSPPKGISSDGPYHMVDLLCQDYMCDCHKVSIAITDEARKSVLATVAYGWKSKGHYYRWGLDKDTAGSLTSGFLDPWCIQTVHSPFFLSFIRRKINSEPGFMSRIKKRYRIFKDRVDSPLFTPVVFPPPPLPENVVPLNAHRRVRG